MIAEFLAGLVIGLLGGMVAAAGVLVLMAWYTMLMELWHD